MPRYFSTAFSWKAITRFSEQNLATKTATGSPTTSWYKSNQAELEIYRFMAMSAARETRHSQRLLDIGNGGVFTFPIAHIPEVVAIDVFVEEDFKTRYPTVEWQQMSALDMHFERPFDTIIEINTMHHIIGDSVRGTYDNLDRLMAAVAANLAPEAGRFSSKARCRAGSSHRTR